MREISSFDEFRQELGQAGRILLLLYKKGSESSDCAHNHLGELSQNTKDIRVLAADVNVVRDIHPVYSVSSAPSLLEFRSGELKNVTKGCHEKEFFEGLLKGIEWQSQYETEGRSAPQVTVYSTPTCSYCTSLKSYLRTKGVRFQEIDISRDERMAKDLVARSGQTGVPQTEIDGEIVVGFDRNRINDLLGINR